MKLFIVVMLAGIVPGSALAQDETVAIDSRVRTEASQVGRDLARNPAQTGALQQLVAVTPSADVNEVVFYVLRESYLEATEDLKHYANKVKYFNTSKQSLGETLEAYGAQMAQMAAALATCDGSRAACDPQQVVGQTARLEAALGQVEADLAGAGGDLQDLRDSLQRNRQLIAVTRERLAVQPAPRPAETGAVQPAFRPGVAALAAPQTFTNPMNGDRRLDLCRVWGAECGQPAADAYCQQRGFARAGAWQAASDIGASTPTRTLGDALECAEPYCDGFAAITCTP